MEVSSLSATSLPSSPYCQPTQYHFTARRSQSVRPRRKRARLQPRPRTSASTSMSPLPAELDPTTGGTGNSASRAQPADISSSPAFGRPRRTTVQSDIQEAILHPGNVRINVQGAFIVDEEQPGTPQSEDYEHDPKDIRLPNHTAVVSHIALDVSVNHRSRASRNAARDQRSESQPSFLGARTAVADRFCSIDWRITRKACILLARTWRRCDWWPTELPQVRDRPDRCMH
jgi:hypothetical protein